MSAETIKKAEAEAKRLIAYRDTYATPQGRKALLDMLAEYGVFSCTVPTNSPEAAELRNYGMKVLQRAGLELANMEEIMVNAVLNAASEIDRDYLTKLLIQQFEQEENDE